MALHGQVMVNRDVIGWWSARRLRSLGEDLDEVFEYACEVVWTPETVVGLGKPFPRVQFHVEHQYSLGAMALAAKVLTHVSEVSE